MNYVRYPFSMDLAMKKKIVGGLEQLFDEDEESETKTARRKRIRRRPRASRARPHPGRAARAPFKS